MTPWFPYVSVHISMEEYNLVCHHELHGKANTNRVGREKTSISKKKTKSALRIMSKLNKLSIYDLTCVRVKVYAYKCKKDKSAFIFKAAQYWLSDHTSIHL